MDTFGATCAFFPIKIFPLAALDAPKNQDEIRKFQKNEDLKGKYKDQY